jgi:hypothetical protein
MQLRANQRVPNRGVRLTVDPIVHATQCFVPEDCTRSTGAHQSVRVLDKHLLIRRIRKWFAEHILEKGDCLSM